MKSRAVRIATIAMVLIALPVLAFLFMSVWMAPPDDLDLSRSKATANGLYAVAIAPEADAIPGNQLHSWVLTVTTPNGEPVEGATVAVDGGMPQHGHGLPTAPEATAYLGEGRYRIEGVRFNMSGWWEFKFDISAAPGEDTVTFNLSL